MSTLVTLVTIALVLSVAIPVLIYVKSEKGVKSKKIALFTNIGMYFTLMVASVIAMCTGAVGAEEAAAASMSSGMGYLAAGLATGMATIGAGIAVGAAASAALGAISENEKVFGKALVFVALAEGVALYGLLISFMIIGNL